MTDFKHILIGEPAGFNFNVDVEDIEPAEPALPDSATDLSDQGFSGGEIDRRLILLAYTYEVTEQSINLSGNSSRTTASDDAIYKLTVILNNNITEDA